jgi:hypothetical protein
MRTHCGTRHVTVLLGLGAFAALLAGSARVSAAQDAATTAASDTAPMSIIVAVFPGPTGADQAMNSMNPGQTANVESYAVVSKDKSGHVKVHQKHAKKGSRHAAQANQAIDGAIALLGHPLRGDQQSNAPSQAEMQAGLSPDNMGQVEHILLPDNSAIVFVVDTPDVSNVDSAMQQAHASQVMDAKIQPSP